MRKETSHICNKESEGGGIEHLRNIPDYSRPVWIRKMQRLFSGYVAGVGHCQSNGKHTCKQLAII